MEVRTFFKTLRGSQARTSNELRKIGTFLSPSTVRSIWLRHEFTNFKQRQKALDAHAAETGGALQHTGNGYDAANAFAKEQGFILPSNLAS